MALYTKLKILVLLLLISVGARAGYRQSYGTYQGMTSPTPFSHAVSAGVMASAPSSDFYSTSSMLSTSSRGRRTGVPGDPGEPGYNPNQGGNSGLPDDPAEPGEIPDTPIGSAWILLLCAALYGAISLLRHRKTI